MQISRNQLDEKLAVMKERNELIQSMIERSRELTRSINHSLARIQIHEGLAREEEGRDDPQ